VTDFTDQINAFKAKLRRQAEAVVHETVIQLGSALVEKSPWGRWEQWTPQSKQARPMPPYVPGLFKGSWDYAFGSPPIEQLDTIDMTGTTSMARIAAVRSVPAFVTHYLVNNTEYAWALEYGHAVHNIPDPTPPSGMVRTTEVEFRTYVGVALERAKQVI
jgi:hypothetical protein